MSPSTSPCQNSLIQTQELPASLRHGEAPPKWRLKPSKLQEIKANRHSVVTSSPRSAYGEAANVIRCQCSSARLEGRTVRKSLLHRWFARLTLMPQIRCEGCGTLVISPFQITSGIADWSVKQHQHCYGFLVDSPPPEHVCYRCLLGESATSRMETLKRLCKLRRVLWVIYEERWSVNDVERMAGRLGLTMFTLVFVEAADRCKATTIRPCSHYSSGLLRKLI